MIGRSWIIQINNRPMFDGHPLFRGKTLGGL